MLANGDKHHYYFSIEKTLKQDSIDGKTRHRYGGGQLTSDYKAIVNAILGEGRAAILSLNMGNWTAYSWDCGLERVPCNAYVVVL